MAKRFLYIALLLLPASMWAQAFFHGLSSNASLTEEQAQKTKRATDAVPDTINLPFFDDFAYSGPYPSLQFWTDKKVFVNNNLPINPPSAGVATFDIFDANGNLYSYAQTSPFISDFLTSKPIDLSGMTVADSLYISFFVQAKGRGWDKPDRRDSLVLQAYSKTGKWLNLWSVSDANDFVDFKEIYVNLKDTNLFYKGFKFRFYNYASIGSSENQEDAINNDFWHLDYVYLNKDRSLAAKTKKDVAFTSFSNRIFKQYYSVPYSHYQASIMTLDTLSLVFYNHYNSTQSVNNITYILRNEEGLRYDSLGNASINVAGSKSTAMKYPLNDPSNHLEGYPKTMSDSTILKSTFYFKEIASDVGSEFNWNDTVRFEQKFYNYYAFDDGTPESGFSLIGDAAKYAFKVNALKADTLRGVSIFFNQYKDFGTSDIPVFSLCVWKNEGGKPGELIYKEDNLKAEARKGYLRFTDYKFKTPIWVEDTFFVGWRNDTRKVYNLGYDMNNTNQQQVYYKLAAGSWKPINQGMPMIRPLMGDDFKLVSVPERTADSQNLLVYPNPTKGELKIMLREAQNISITLLSSLGKILLKKDIHSQDSINLFSYPSGIYFIKIDIDGRSVVRKIIKQ